MSRGKKDTRAEKKSAARRDRDDITLAHIIGLLKVVCFMSGGLLGASLILYLVFPKSADSSVVYVMVIFINLFVFVGSFLGTIWLSKKDKQLEIKEQEKFKKEMTASVMRDQK